MISTKSLLLGLTALLSFDIILTAAAVGYMGAIELNTFPSTIGFQSFMVLKIVASTAAIYTIYTYCIPSAPTFTRHGMMAVGVVYGAVFASNVYQMARAVV